MKHHFLSFALYALEGVGIHDTEFRGLKYATEGKHYYYDEDEIIKDFMSGRRDIARIYMHSILHCLYLHPYFAGQYIDNELWDLACDLFVWDILDHLEPCDSSIIRNDISGIKQTDLIVSAQNLYSRLRLMRLDGKITNVEIKRYQEAVKVDDHDLWYRPSQNRKGAPDSGDTAGNLSCTEEQLSSNYMAGNFTSVIKKWQTAADRAIVGLETAISENGKHQGIDPGNLIETLKGIEAEDISYDEFLRKFAAMEERMVVDIDSFDYNYYIYGLDIYGDMPLVEPVEFKEMHTIREFVIAIDTSGSIDSETLKKFLTKTYNILRESIFADDSLDVRVMQCDADVQNVEIIHTKSDMENYINNLKVYGRGGTDFRPVFERIEEYRNSGELKNIRGLIYFTDGYGTYPTNPTNYKTAFVYSETFRDSDIPSWISKYHLREDFS